MAYGPSSTGDGAARGVRALLASGATGYGGWCMMPGALGPEILGVAGVDWLCIDCQHGLIDDAEMRLMVQAAAIRRTPVLVRPPWNEPSAIMRALDAGADGVIVPMVNSAADARAAAAATRFPPDGTRSWGPLRPALMQPGYNPALANELALCLPMVETIEAVAELDAILDTPGVDGVFVGPKDLALSHSGSLATAGNGPRDLEVFAQVADGCRRRGLVAATICDTVSEATRCREMGYGLIALRTDASLLGEAMSKELAATRAAESEKDARG